MQFAARIIVAVVCLALALYGFPRDAFGEDSLPQGASTSDEAASASGDSSREVGDQFLRFGYAQQPDTTQTFEFPEEENQHLIRDIAIFVIASAFVAFFIIKVFIEEDQEEEDSGGGGKDLPPF